MRLFGILVILLSSWVTPAWAWDCQEPAIDCSTLIVRSQAALGALTSGARTKRLKSYDLSLVDVPKGQDPQTFLDTLSTQPGILYVEPALKTQLAETRPNDPLFDKQYYYDGQYGEDLAINEAWSLLTASPIIVAVIDSGVDYTHPDLAANIWTNIGEIPGNGTDDDKNGYVDDVYGYNFYDNEPDPYDDYLHGTHVAGIIGAVGNNGIGVTGMVWDIQLMSLRFTDTTGAGNTAKAMEAIHYAVDNGARVINLSWTVVASSSAGGSRALQDVIRSYSEQGIVFVAAAGNGDETGYGFNTDETPVLPASIESPNLISVAAAGENGKLAPFSNYGLNSVHILAPGLGILSTFPGNDYGHMNGTSAATGFVSAAAAMILTEAPELTADEVKVILLTSVNEDPDLSGIILSSGSLNVMNSLQSIGSGKTLANLPQPNPNASVSHSVDAGGCTLVAGSATSQTQAPYLIALALLSLLAMRQRST